MSKLGHIRFLNQQGKSAKDIIAETGFTDNFVRACLSYLQNPRAAHLKNARWERNNPDKVSAYRRNALRVKQNATRPFAVKHAQEWSLKDLEYLRVYGKQKTAKELAVELGRSYCAVRTAAHKYGIDMRSKEKVRAKPFPETPNYEGRNI